MTDLITLAYEKTITQNYPVFGPDLSHHQGFVDWNKIARWASFVILRVGSGGTNAQAFEDSRYREYYTAAGVQKLPRGAYWYFVPEFDAKAQAEFFIQRLLLYKCELDAFIDIEENKTGLTTEELRKRIRTFTDEVDRRTGKNCGIYTSYGFISSHLQFNLGLPMFDRTVWVASWRSMTPTMIPGTTKWDFWQFSAQGNNLGRQLGVSSASLDLNVYQGDMEKFKKEYNLKDDFLSQAPSVTLPPKSVKPMVNMNLRSGPGEGYTSKGLAYQGSEWEVLSVVGNNPSKQWAKVADKTFLALWLCQRIV